MLLVLTGATAIRGKTRKCLSTPSDATVIEFVEVPWRVAKTFQRVNGGALDSRIGVIQEP
jgi:hypothetical protein